MKLLEKNNRIFFRFTTLLLLLGSVMFYFAVHFIIQDEIDEKLEVSRLRTIKLLEKGEAPPHFYPILEVEVLSGKTPAAKKRSHTMVYDPLEQEEEPYRQLISTIELNGKAYRITNRTSLVEKEDLMIAIGGCTLGLALLLFLGLYWLNRRSAQELWKPFQLQLAALNNFSLAQNEQLALEDSDIQEFSSLKSALQQLTEKLRADYRNLKEFTENASHEIQTPLAIICSKIESLIENEQLTGEQMGGLTIIYEASNRLSRLNRSLLLLAKIENRQFLGTAPVSIKTVIEEQLKMLEELTAAKNLRLEPMLRDEDLTVQTNRTLAEILVKNLLENAIRYSQHGDTISIVSSTNKITFGNPGAQAAEHPDRLFKRFRKEGNHQSSTGLGLAIVEKICEVNGWQSAYAFREGRHEFEVSFLEVV